MSFTTPDPAYQGEILESGSGGAMPPPPPTPGKGRRRAFIGGGVVGGLALLGAGGWVAYSMFFATGAQPAEALPASTIGYVSIDLNPSGQQKLEAIDTLKKFPALKEQLDIDSQDDVKKKIFDAAQDSGACEGLDYDEDVKPWLGDRLAVAAVDLGKKDDAGKTDVTPVLVIAVKDAGKADDGLKKLRDCATASDAEPSSSSEGSDDIGGWSISGDWAVLAETEEIAKEVTDAAADKPLSEDAAFTKWTEKAGDPGILTAYASPDAGEILADQLSNFPFDGPRISSCSSVPQPVAPPTPSTDDESQGYGENDHTYQGAYGSENCDEQPTDTPENSERSDAVKTMFKDFGGAAVTVRFNDGALEIETAADSDFTGLSKITGTSSGDDVIATLPDDTAAAFGVGFDEGWFGDVLDYARTFVSDGEVDSFLQEAEDQTGLSFPEDIEALVGQSAAIAVGGDFDPENDDPSTYPVGVKIKGDSDEITRVMDKLLATPEVSPEFSDVVGYDKDGDYVAAGPSEDYRSKLLEDGDLGENDLYQEVVSQSDDASSVVFVNFNAFDGLLEQSLGSNHEIRDNLTPLAALGITSWTDDDGASHGMFKLTTD